LINSDLAQKDQFKFMIGPRSEFAKDESDFEDAEPKKGKPWGQVLGFSVEAVASNKWKDDRLYLSTFHPSTSSGPSAFYFPFPCALPFTPFTLPREVRFTPFSPS
jgi:hypothetical protein